MVLCSFIVMLLCFSIVGYAGYWQSKREFYRRNNYGVQEFNGHTDMMKKTALEYIVFIFTVPIGLLGFLSMFVFAFFAIFK